MCPTTQKRSEESGARYDWFGPRHAATLFLFLFLVPAHAWAANPDFTPQEVFQLIGICLGFSLLVIGIHYLHSLRDQKFWDKVDIAHGRQAANEKMANRLSARRWVLAAVTILCIVSALLSYNFLSFPLSVLGIFAGLSVFALGGHVLYLRKTFLLPEVRLAMEAEPDPPAEAPSGGTWLVRVPSGKTFSTPDTNVIAKALDQGKIQDDAMVQPPGSEEWLPVREAIAIKGRA